MAFMKRNRPWCMGTETNVFDRFFKTDTTRNMDKTGSGIGLAIVREFLQAHGETITVKSEKGKGAAFVFSLKLAKKEN